MIQEVVIISGKGGTGKTSLAASFAVLADQPVIADCDVDAADLHLILAPQVKERHDFFGGHEAVIRPADCIACGECLELCRFGAVLRREDPASSPLLNIKAVDCNECDFCSRSCSVHDLEMIKMMRESGGDSREPVFIIDPISCEGCGVCVEFCPVQAIDFRERLCGEWMVSATRCGPMVHARLGIAAENSGKLVSLVRREARRIAEEEGHKLILVDGPPGIGCPVIASVTGADLVLAVTEPTLSGEHDLARLLSLTRHFNIPTAVCVNKWDLNPEMTERIEARAQEKGARLLGRIRYCQDVTKAQMQARAVVELETPIATEIRKMWEKLNHDGLLESGR